MKKSSTHPSITAPKSCCATTAVGECENQARRLEYCMRFAAIVHAIRCDRMQYTKLHAITIWNRMQFFNASKVDACELCKD